PRLVLSLLLFKAPPPTEIYTLSLHDALPISVVGDTVDALSEPDRAALRKLAVFERGFDASGALAVADATPRQLLHLRESAVLQQDRKSTRLNSSHVKISYAVFCLKKKTQHVT